jgi:hypothetical protein
MNIEYFDNNCNSITIPTLESNNGCFLDKKFFSEGRFKDLRKENLNNYESEYTKLMNNTQLNNDNEHHTKIVCLMNLLLNNIEEMTKNNKTKSNIIINSQAEKSKNKLIIDRNKDLYEKNQNYNLLKKHRIVNSENRLKRNKMEYIIYVSLIIIIVFIQLLILVFIL